MLTPITWTRTVSLEVVFQPAALIFYAHHSAIAKSFPGPVSHVMISWG